MENESLPRLRWETKSELERFVIYKSSCYGGHGSLLCDEGAERTEAFKKSAGQYQTKDPDQYSELLQKIYCALWPELTDFMKSESIGFCSDTMTSAQTMVNSAIQTIRCEERIGCIYKKKRSYGSTNSMIALFANDELTGFSERMREQYPLLEGFLKYNHTIGNYCPVPRGFNTARSGAGKCDMWDLTLMKIREYYYAADASSKEKILNELLHSQGDRNACQRWLEHFRDKKRNDPDSPEKEDQGWRNFVDTLMFQDYVDEDYQVCPFWSGHSWEDLRIPQEQLNAVFAEIACRIKIRSCRIVCALQKAEAHRLPALSAAISSL